MSGVTGRGTEQEAFWAGDFGNAYTVRNDGEAWIASNTAFFARALARTRGVRSVLELGANRGLNLVALHRLIPGLDATGVEINASAHAALNKLPGTKAVHGSFLGYRPAATVDLAFTKTVLIHVNPQELPGVYDTLFSCSHRYVLIAEYFSPTPVEVEYRGHSEKLFKRDFAGEMLDRFGEKIALLDYGFHYRRDPNFLQDNLNWFLLERV